MEKQPYRSRFSFISLNSLQKLLSAKSLMNHQSKDSFFGLIEYKKNEEFLAESTGDEVPDKVLRLFGNRISKMKDSGKHVDSDLWHACAGSMVKVPAINSLVYYFPQGHAEHAQFPLTTLHNMNTSHMLCRVVSLKLMADPETDEVYVKIRLVPVKQNPGAINNTPAEVPEMPISFTKTLTQSDANNGGGFSVPRQCAITIFPNLNYQDDPPVQSISCIDVHGETWTFRHIYRGSPKRHLLTTGWSTFVSQKKLVAGDSIVFLRKGSGEIHIGIRRMKPSYTSVKFLGFNNSNMFSRRARKESVMEAVKNALSGQVFEGVYYPSTGTPEYIVKAELVREAAMIPWCSGMRFKMAVESEDQSRISWFMGTVTGVERQKSLWRQLEVRWEDAGGVLNDVKRVNPWLVEPVSSMYMPPVHLDKRPCLQLPPYDYLSCISPLALNGHQLRLPLPQLQYRANTGIQGSRHNDYTGKFTATAATNKRKSSFRFRDDDVGKDDVACELTIGVGHAAATTARTRNSKKKSTSTPAAALVLFGKAIMNNAEEEQIADVNSSGPSGTANPVTASSSDSEVDDNALLPTISFI